MYFRKINNFLKQQWLWVAAVTISLPLLIILIVQYQSLRKLEQTLPAYRRESLHECLSTVVREVEKVYSDNTARVLAVSADSIAGQESGVIESNSERTRVLARLAEHFRRQEFRGAKRFFVALATELEGTSRNEVLFYNPVSQDMEIDPQAPELRPINVACAPYMIYIRSRSVVQPSPVGIDRDSDHPLIVKPLLDEEQRIVAIVGLTLDQEWFRNEVLPNALASVLPRFFPAEYRNADVTLRLLQKDLVYTSQPGGTFKPEGDFKSEGNPKPETATRFMPFFQWYALGLRMRHLSVEQWARRSFVINLTLSLVMTLALAGGLLLGLRAAAREARLSRMKTDFVANVSHEFRTPLATIQVLAEIMKLGRVKQWDKVREYGESISSQSQRLTQLINNILDFSRIESGRQGYQFELTDITEVVNGALEVCAGQIKQSGHRIEVELPEQSLPMVRLDTSALTLALTNLLDNAIKYSGDSKQITLRLAQDVDAIAISVIDHGSGIPRDEQEKIFEKFYRISTGMVHDVKGTGLGLSIVKHIVEAHRGKVSVESAPGRGSAFAIRLPVAKQNDDVRQSH